MDEDILLNIYDETTQILSGEDNLLDDLKVCEDRYKDLHKLTAGGMKDVYKCYDSHTDSQVILVTPRKPELNEAFVREGRILSFLKHPNIMSVSDMGLTVDKKPFFTMKYYAGEDFSQYLKKSKGLPEKLSHFQKVCDAVNYAHSRGIIHLDLKPENIRIGQYGEVSVGDWGIAEFNYEVNDSEDSYLDKDLRNVLMNRKPVDSKNLSGTPGYIAPERFKNPEPTVGNDIYSLGAILYEILSGKPPKDSKVAYSDAYPTGLLAICRKALHKSLEERYENMSEFVADLNRFTRGYATKAENAGLLRQLKLFYDRNRRFSQLLATSVILISVILLVSFSRISESRKIALNEKDAANKARQETETLLKELQAEQERSVGLMHTAAESHLVIARQRLMNYRFSEAEKNFQLAKQLNPESIHNIAFESKLKFVRRDWVSAEKLFVKLNNRFGVELSKHLSKISDKQIVAELGDIQKLLGRHFTVYFLMNSLERDNDLQTQKELYLWALRERHVGMIHFPEVVVNQDEEGVKVSFAKSLAVKFVGPLKFLKPVKLNLANSGLIYETGLNECEDLIELDISGTGMLGAGALRLKKLRRINVSQTSFNDSRQFKAMPSLEEIDVSFTRIKSFEGFRSLPRLRKLIIDESQLKNARKAFPKLEIVIKK